MIASLLKAWRAKAPDPGDSIEVIANRAYLYCEADGETEVWQVIRWTDTGDDEVLYEASPLTFDPADAEQSIRDAGLPW